MIDSVLARCLISPGQCRELVVENPTNAIALRTILEDDGDHPLIDPLVINEALPGNYDLFLMAFDSMEGNARLAHAVIEILAQHDALGRDAEEYASRVLAERLAVEELAAEARRAEEEAAGLAAAMALQAGMQDGGGFGGGVAGAAEVHDEPEPDVVSDARGVALHPADVNLIRTRMPFLEAVYLRGVTDADGVEIGKPQEWGELITRHMFYVRAIIEYLAGDEFRAFIRGKTMAEAEAHLAEKFPSPV